MLQTGDPAESFNKATEGIHYFNCTVQSFRPPLFACYIKADIQLKMKPISTKLLHMLERNVTRHLLLLTIDVANQS